MMPDDLTPFERWQLGKYGDVLPPDPVFVLFDQPQPMISTAYDAHIFLLENPE